MAPDACGDVTLSSSYKVQELTCDMYKQHEYIRIHDHVQKQNCLLVVSNFLFVTQESTRQSKEESSSSQRNTTKKGKSKSILVILGQICIIYIRYKKEKIENAATTLAAQYPGN
jgi:hypothetical protein